ncbi:radical SAM protein [Planctomycetales bacterium]|nr:radical SAM protein [Planctomycetales bacterium]
MQSLTQHHPRSFGNFRYVYPVISRRSGGLSVGLNISPTAKCNFSCVYCQVLGELDEKMQNREPLPEDESVVKHPKNSPLIAIDVLETELRTIVKSALDGSLFVENFLSKAPPEKRFIKDIAFSGDGEPTLSAQFPEIAKRVIEIRKKLCPPETKIIVITNGTTLRNAYVKTTLRELILNNGEVWAKLDAGTEEYYKAVARSAFPYGNILQNLTETAKEIPLVIQTCFLSLHNVIPNKDEIKSYIERLNSITESGGNILRIQIYTVARITPEPWVQPLEKEHLDAISEYVRTSTGLKTETYYSS